MRPEIISNDFGRFGNLLADSNSSFGVVENSNFNDSNFWCVRGSSTHNVTVHVHVLWLCLCLLKIVSLIIHDSSFLHIQGVSSSSFKQL